MYWSQSHNTLWWPHLCDCHYEMKLCFSTRKKWNIKWQRHWILKNLFQTTYQVTWQRWLWRTLDCGAYFSIHVVLVWMGPPPQIPIHIMPSVRGQVWFFFQKNNFPSNNTILKFSPFLGTHHTLLYWLYSALCDNKGHIFYAFHDGNYYYFSC